MRLLHVRISVGNSGQLGLVSEVDYIPIFCSSTVSQDQYHGCRSQPLYHIQARAWKFFFLETFKILVAVYPYSLYAYVFLMRLRSGSPLSSLSRF